MRIRRQPAPVDLLTELEQLVLAQAAFEEALAIRQRSLEPTDPRIANSLNNLGRFLRGMGKLEEAEARLREGQAVAENAFGEIHPLLATLDI